MQYVCSAETFIGAAIMFASMFRFYRILADFHIQPGEGKRTYSSKQGLCMALMVFFFIGYIIMGICYIFWNLQVSGTDFLVANIFLFGALFVWLVIANQAEMYETINDKRDEIIRALVNTVEAKDQYTHGHSEHVSKLIGLFYERLPASLRREVNRMTLMDAAILHDAGKIGIPDQILNKPGELTEEEMAAIREHPRLGKQILDNTSFKEVGEVIFNHHERMDGTGYYGVPAEKIPLESRMIAIADTFSALYSERCYRQQMGYKEAVAILKNAAGTQFDAQLVDIFCEIPKKDIDRATGKPKNIV